MRKKNILLLGAALITSSYAAPAPALACGGEGDDDHDREEIRDGAGRRVRWHRDEGEHERDCREQGRDCRRHKPPVSVQLLGFNDFHGQLETGKKVSGRPVGGAAVMAAWLENAAATYDGTTILVHAGDQVGASPAASALLQDEPSITFLNLLANKHCSFRDLDNPRCNLVGTLGNHEFDEGVDEMLRVIYGGNHPNGPFLGVDPWTGAKFPYISANVVDAQSGKPILPPYVVKKAGDVKVAFIGAVLKGTPTIVTPTGVAGVNFLDEADAINKYVRKLRREGVETFVVTIHQGGSQPSYLGQTQAGAAIVGPEINDIVSRLDSAVDVVVSGHTHQFSNALVNNAQGHPILVTQAFSASTAYGAIDLLIDGDDGDVIEKSAVIQTTWGDEGPGLTPDPTVAQLVASAVGAVAPLVNQVIGTASSDLTRTQDSAGESALGDLIADAQRADTGTDFAFMNQGGIRNDITAGQVTWGQLFSVQPFGNSLVTMKLTGQQIYDVLNQNLYTGPTIRVMQVSGFTYTWDAALPAGARVTEVRKGGQLIDKNATYSITCNNFMAAGGDGYTVFTKGTSQVGGDVDLDALIKYVKGIAQPFTAAIDGRMTRKN